MPVTTDLSFEPSVLFTVPANVAGPASFDSSGTNSLNVGKSDERGCSRPDPACTRHSQGDQITNKPPSRVPVNPSPARGSKRQGDGWPQLIMPAPDEGAHTVVTGGLDRWDWLSR